MEQLTLSFEPGLTHKYRSLLECIAAGVYHHGLQRVAGKLDAAPSNLSTALSADTNRKFGVDDLEVYFDEVKDLDPLFYQIERWLKGREVVNKGALLNRADTLLNEFRSVIEQIKD